MTTKPKIAIVGAGNIGCYLGACLLSSGHDVVLVGRERIKGDIDKHGLHVTDYLGRDAHLLAEQVTYVLNYDALSGCDYILVTVKSNATENVAEQLSGKLKPGAILVSLQNGLGNAELLETCVSQNTVLRGMVPFNVVNTRPGHFHQGTEGALCIESLSTPSSGTTDATDPLSVLVRAFQNSALEVKICTDMLTVQWGKLLMNLNNSINALSGKPLYDQLQDAGYRRVLALCIDEALASLKIARIKPARTGKVIPSLVPSILRLPNWAFKRVAAAMLAIDREARSSMAEDIALGRPTEIDFLNGEVIKLADRFSCPVPVNRRVVALIKNLEQASEKHFFSSSELLQVVIV